jgi:trk system potassium uptake protein TrkH
MVPENRSMRRRELRPIQFIVLSFALVILLGSFLLWLPISAQPGQSTSYIDALFTSTSATCVTGLVVVDTDTHYSLSGEIVILLLIQLGGLGYMTLASFIPILLGRRVDLLDRIRLAEQLNFTNLKGVVLLAKYVLGTVLICEGLGAVILFFRFLRDLPPLKALWAGIFQSVSAFCNAGFDVLGSNFGPFTNLTPYRGDATVSLTICALIILGGLGFFVIANSVRHFRYRDPIHLQTRVVLATTAALLLFGTVAVLVLEWNNPNTLGNLPFGEKLLSSFFQSVTPRTAGFNTLNIGGMNVSTLMVLALLMFIGASPGGTGGGVKTSTFALLIATVRSTVRGYPDTVLFGRRIDPFQVRRAVSIIAVSFALVVAASVLLSLTDTPPFHALVFEVTSAFGTVGLSTGITPSLTGIGKIVIILVMFVGRVGPLSLFLLFTQRRREARVRYPEEEVNVG